jgi:diguanylate cyclase (GGDEF)-like protein
MKGTSLPRRLTTAGQRRWRRTGLRARLALALTLVALLPLLTLYWTIHERIASNATTAVRGTLALIANAQQRRINTELQRLQDLTQLVASRTQLRLSLRAYRQDDDPRHLALMTRILQDVVDSMPQVRGVWVRDLQGSMLVRVTRGRAAATAFDSAAIPVDEPAPILFRQLDTPDPQLWLSDPLILDEVAIGSIHLLVRLDGIDAVLQDFSNQQAGGQTLLLVRDPRTDALFALSGHTGGWQPHRARPSALNSLLQHLYPPPGPCTAIASAQTQDWAQTLLYTQRAVRLDCSSLLVAMSLDRVTQRIQAGVDLLLLITTTLFLLALLTAIALSSAIAKPIRTLTAAMERLADGDYQTRIKERSWGELALLSRAFNSTASALQREHQARRRSEQDLRNLANTDALTGLNNRRHFLEILTRQVEQQRHSDEQGALLYLDLDDFKPINDEYGHAAGDAVLRIVAERLRNTTRDQDRVGRLGGDEFAILLDRIASNAELEQLLERIRQALSQPIQVQGHTIRVGCSIGVAPIRPEATPASLLQEADAAMYRIKVSRRDRQRG